MTTPSVLGASSLSPHHASCRWHNFPVAAGLRHARTAKGLDDGGPDACLGHWPLKGSQVQTVAQLREPLHYVLGEVAVTAIILPGGAPLGLDLFEDGATGMIVSLGSRAVPPGGWWRGRPGRQWRHGSLCYPNRRRRACHNAAQRRRWSMGLVDQTMKPRAAVKPDFVRGPARNLEEQEDRCQIVSSAGRRLASYRSARFGVIAHCDRKAFPLVTTAVCSGTPDKTGDFTLFSATDVAGAPTRLLGGKRGCRHFGLAHAATDLGRMAFPADAESAVVLVASPFHRLDRESAAAGKVSGYGSVRTLDGLPLHCSEKKAAQCSDRVSSSAEVPYGSRDGHA